MERRAVVDSWAFH